MQKKLLENQKMILSVFSLGDQHTYAEVEALTGLKDGAVYLNVGKLADLGLLERVREGNRVYLTLTLTGEEMRDRPNQPLSKVTLPRDLGERIVDKKDIWSEEPDVKVLVEASNFYIVTLGKGDGTDDYIYRRDDIFAVVRALEQDGMLEDSVYLNIERAVIR